MRNKYFIITILIISIGALTYLWQKEAYKVKDLNQKLIEAYGKHATAGDTLVKIEDIKNQQKIELENLRKSNETLTNSLAKKTEAYNQVSIALKGSEKLLSAAKSEAKNLHQENKNLISREQDLRKKLASLENDLKNSNQELAKFKSSNANLNSSEANFEMSLCPQSETEENKQKILNEIAEIKLEGVKAQAELNTLRSNLSKEYSKLSKIKKELAQIIEPSLTQPEAMPQLYVYLANRFASSINDDQISISQNAFKINLALSNKLIFSANSDTISKEGHKILDDLSQSLKSITNAQIIVTSPPEYATDKKNTVDKNKDIWVLASNRAAAIVNYISAKTNLPNENFEVLIKQPDYTLNSPEEEQIENQGFLEIVIMQ